MVTAGGHADNGCADDTTMTCSDDGGDFAKNGDNRNEGLNKEQQTTGSKDGLENWRLKKKQR